ncbi:hypothetical protein [Nonomuraea basaltis]|nr:hypothetical protein [Nonomuraea basaltis]
MSAIRVLDRLAPEGPDSLLFDSTAHDFENQRTDGRCCAPGRSYASG